jgi:hypothetical protein
MEIANPAAAELAFKAFSASAAHSDACVAPTLTSRRSSVGVFQHQFLAVVRTTRKRPLSVWIAAFALPVVPASRLLADLLPVIHDRRQFCQMFAA